ncbi:MAG: cysteine--tRNA ligase [Deltaproteobacteria bacterium]|nr:cysteine--tRNA ligase [Deltaproteobacteria bacterium]
MAASAFQVRSSSKYLSSARKIQIYNSLGKAKQPFLPIDKSDPPRVKMYVCGLTPYDSAHMGHVVPALAFDLVRNYLTYRNLQVNFVQNVTDIDDKIIDRVRKTGEDPRALTEGVTERFYAALKEMRVGTPDRIVKVSETMPQIVSYIEALIKKGFAYATKDGNVYFDIAKKSDYGKLSNQKLSELLSGVRVDSEKDKRHALDFALWKNDPDSTLSVNSPWGVGRPGWHIECSVMIDHTLGSPIDIHGGGLDLKFPHHENEIAQSEAYSKGDFVRYWMHVGLLTVEGTKMSKSLGNFLTIEDAYEQYGPELIRYIFLVHHYRSNVNLSDQAFIENLNGLWDFYRTVELVRARFGAGDPASDHGPIAALRSSFESAMDDDFNSPVAIVALRQALSELRKLLTAPPEKRADSEITSLTAAIVEYGRVLGLFQFDCGEVFSQMLRFTARILKIQVPSLEAIASILKDREDARSKKDYQRSDKLRDELKALGLEYMDTKGLQLSPDELYLNLRFQLGG